MNGAGILIIIVLLIIKYLGDSRNNAASEIESLVPEPEKIIGLPYGTDEDNNYKTGSSNSSDDVYDGKICVICYDVLRNCFFVPCGHCATCHDCAIR